MGEIVVAMMCNKSNPLLVNVRRTNVEWGNCALWWLGQQGFIIKSGDTILGIDLFLTDMRQRKKRPLIKPEQLNDVNYILGTHDHDDHIDRPVWPSIAERSSQTVFVVPELIRERLSRELQIPVKRFIGLNDLMKLHNREVKITAMASAHEFLDKDTETGLFPYLGYVIEINGCVIYHAGDTCIYDGLVTKLNIFKPDIMLLPINGRDAKRFSNGCPGNMTYQEAADLAGTVSPQYVIPTHYDMIIGNDEDPQLFVDYMRVKYPAVDTVVCEYGIRNILRCR